MKTAELVSRLKGWTGQACLYRLSEPLDGNETVIVSSTTAQYGGPETFIFPATDTGKVIDWLALDGSYRGGLDHKTALSGAGYELLNMKQKKKAKGELKNGKG